MSRDAQQPAQPGGHAMNAASLCPRGDDCALNSGARHCFHCGRNWPPDETWTSSEGQGAHPRTPSQSDAAARPEATLPGPESGAAYCERHGVVVFDGICPDCRVSWWCLLWNRVQAKLHGAYPCRTCGYAYNCPDGECHS